MKKLTINLASYFLKSNICNKVLFNMITSIKYNDNHPEIKDGELVVKNCGSRIAAEAYACSYPSGRVGKIAKNQQGERINGFPVFTKIAEYEKRYGRNARPKDSEFNGVLWTAETQQKSASPPVVQPTFHSDQRIPPSVQIIQTEEKSLIKKN